MKRFARFQQISQRVGQGTLPLPFILFPSRPERENQPGGLIALLWIGVVVLACSVIKLGLGLVIYNLSPSLSRALPPP